MKCPQCESREIEQYRMPFGPMWCRKCNYRVEEKNEFPNPFLEESDPYYRFLKNKHQLLQDKKNQQEGPPGDP